MDTTSYVNIRVTQRYRVSAARVFDAWLDPKIAGKWLFATASRPMTSVAIDARVGGSFRLVDGRDGEAVEHTGEYIEIVRPKRLVFTLSGEKHRQSSNCVNVEIVPRETGCDLRLVHEGVLPDDAVRAEGRWTGILYGLGVTFGTKDR